MAHSEDQLELLGHIQVFLAEKHFEGCGGLELTDEIRVTIAAQACLLLLHRNTDYFPHLTSILVYPTGYSVEEERHVGGGVWEEGPEDRVGHTSSQLRALVLAWDAVRDGAANPSRRMERRASRVRASARLREQERRRNSRTRRACGLPDLVESDERGARSIASRGCGGAATLLDTYGATNPTEFFAVATEVFFERPRALRARHPELYAELQGFFQAGSGDVFRRVVILLRLLFF